MEEKARLAKEKAEKEALEEGSRPNSKSKAKKPKPKDKKKGKKGKKDDDEEEEEDLGPPIINLDYACQRTNSMPTITAFNDYYKLLNEKVYYLFFYNFKGN